MNIVIPMAGNGSRFQQAGYKKPKPFIDVNGIPMIEVVMKNIFIKNAKYYLIAKQEHLDAEKETVKTLTGKYNITFITLENNKTTEGAACTVLHARKYINNDEMLMFANSDQFVDANIPNFVQDMLDRNLDASIMTFNDNKNDPKWSYAKTDANGLVTQVAEKVVISNQSTVGIYLYRHGKIFVDAAIDMIVRNDRFNNEFYVCPSYNYVIQNGYKCGIYEIPASAMHGMGTPEDLEKFLTSNKVAK